MVFTKAISTIVFVCLVDCVSSLRQPSDPHPDQAADKQKHHLKEMRKHEDEYTRASHEHEKQLAEERDRKAAVEALKAMAVQEKEKRWGDLKAIYKANEDAEREADNQSKEAVYAEHNAWRMSHTLQRAKDEERRRGAKDIEREKARAELDRRAQEEAELMG